MNESRPKTILLVEDEAIIAMAEKLTLEKHGYNVLMVYSGEEAVETARVTPGIDLVLMDIILGKGMDGAAAARIILQSRDVPVLFLSNNAETEVVDRTEIVESYGYVMKQMGEAVLLAAIKAAFRLHDSYRRIQGLHEELEGVYEEMQAAMEELEATNQELIETQKGLTESEHRFSMAFKSSPAPLVISEINTGCFIDVNDAWVQMLGYSREEQLGRTSTEIGIWMNPADRERVVQKLKDTGSFHEEPVNFKTSTGRRVEALWSAETISLGGQDVMLSMIYDITERKQAAEALMASEAFLDSIIEQSPFPIVIFDTKGKITRFNQAVRIHFKRPDAMTFIEQYNLLRDEQLTAQGLMPLIESVFTEGKTARFITRYNPRHPGLPESDSTAYLELDSTVFPVKDSEGHITHVVVYHIDITENIRAQRELADTRVMLESAFEQTPVPMVLVSVPDGIIRIANHAAFEFLGVDKTINPVGKPLFSIDAHWCEMNMDGCPVPLAEMPLAQALKGKTTKNREYCVVRSDGTKRWELVSSAPVYNSEGELIAAFVAFPDITDRRKAEEEYLLNSRRTQALLQLDQMAESGLGEIIDFSLEQAVDLTQSKIGYVAFLDADENFISMHFWPKDIMEECGVTVNPVQPSVINAGFREEAVRLRKPVIINDYPADNPREKKYREGHVPASRHMNVPVFDGNRIVLVAGVWNKDEKYTERDVHHITLLMQGMWRLIEHKRADEALELSEVTYREIFNTVNDAIWIHDMKTGEILDVNATVTEMFGYTSGEAVKLSLGDISSGIYPYIQETAAELLKKAAAGEPQLFDWHCRHKDGHFFWTEVNLRHGIIAGRDCILAIERDITERKRAEKEKETLQSQLIQSQKMESVGRLAGGVAHDFNNMLGVIIGHAELLMAQADIPENISDGLNEIKKAAGRSAELTHQLLAFARKQTVSPKILDLNDTVEGMLKMLRRLIGEDVDLVWLPGRIAGTVKIDPSQVDQILANLCVNARDAIGDAGRITIETGVTVFDEAYCMTHPGSLPGEYILLTVSDNGSGMSQDTLSHIFEPFFTTKASGKGTGLGLATVYGIVKQNSKFINVYSEEGHGTTFRLYLPGHSEKTADAVREDSVSPERGRETILLVEDEPMILEITSTMLAELGYTVLAASGPGEAIKLGREYNDVIHLLITDVVMPEMNGRELAGSLLSVYPDLRCLFMSGYTDDVIAHHGVLNDGVFFIQKPFSIKNLAAKVREVLSGEQ